MQCSGFCVLRADGRFWTGSSWEDSPRNALFFSGVGDPWQKADDLCQSLVKAGNRCSVAYIPLPELKSRRQPARAAAAA